MFLLDPSGYSIIAVTVQFSVSVITVKLQDSFRFGAMTRTFVDFEDDRKLPNNLQ